jgi:hypothetical protein
VNGTAISATNVPPGGPIQIYDYVQPMAAIMKLSMPTLPNGQLDNNGNDLFVYYRSLKQFQCPAAQDQLAAAYAPSTVTTGTFLSYNTAAAFMLLPYGNLTTTGATGRVMANTGSGYWTYPPSYAPRVGKVGTGSQKIYAADGAKYTDSYDTGVPSIEYSSVIDNMQYSDFTDYGAFFGNTKAYDRSGYLNRTGSLRDGRVFAYRHGATGQYLSAGLYRMNAVFYDGHGETLDDMTASNPNYWLPRGTNIPNVGAIITGTRTFVWSDAAIKWCGGASVSYTAN